MSPTWFEFGPAAALSGRHREGRLLAPSVTARAPTSFAGLRSDRPHRQPGDDSPPERSCPDLTVAIRASDEIRFQARVRASSSRKCRRRAGHPTPRARADGQRWDARAQAKTDGRPQSARSGPTPNRPGGDRCLIRGLPPRPADMPTRSDVRTAPLYLPTRAGSACREGLEQRSPVPVAVAPDRNPPIVQSVAPAQPEPRLRILSRQAPSSRA